VSRWLLVELAEDLAAHYQTRTGAWLSIKQVAGVHSLIDLEMVTQETLRVITLPPSEVPVKKPRRARKAS
jgi:hypothetical protein